MQLTSARQWETHVAKIWGAEKHHAAVVDRAPGPNRIFPDIPRRGQLGLHQLWLAAKSQKRFKATPDGALPAELWQLLLGPDTLTGPLSVQFFEQMQWLGCNPQSWCDGQGCVLPKPGGVPGSDGQRIINLLDPAGELFHKALLGLGIDSPADYQYGYVAHRSRRDAILQVEAWLDRLRANKLSTVTTLFDLTKAFDTLKGPYIAAAIQSQNFPDAAGELLLDLHERLRISLPLQEGGSIQMKLNTGVLQGGGTGPRLFRVAYDDCITQWTAQGPPGPVDVTVEYNGAFHQPGVAAYADDLVRTTTGNSLQALQDQDEQNREALRQLLAPRGLQLNDRKGETLLHFSGTGAYNSARLAFSGSWSGYPPKLQVKYLGALIQANGSHPAEIQKRINSAKAGFARFANFSRSGQCRHGAKAWSSRLW